jgi:PST family polysaccharide transporter
MDKHSSFLLHNLLDKLQSLFRTDIRYLLKGTAYLSIGQIFAALSGFLLTIGLVNILDQANYGLYTYILSLAGMVGAFTLSGMDTTVAQAVAKGFDRTLVRGFWSKLCWSIPASIVTLCIGGYYVYNQNYILGVSLLIISLFSPLLSASSLYGSYFNGKKQFKKLAFDNAFRNALITVSILVVAYTTQNVILIILAYFFSNTFISAVRFLYLTKKLPVSDSSSDASSMSLGKHLSVMESFSNISMYIDKIIVFQLLGATALAFYALALAPIKQLQSVSKIIRALVLPKFSIRTEGELMKALPHKTLIFFFASLAVAITYCIIAQLLFTSIFPKYSEALLYSQVLSLGLLFMPFILHAQTLTTLGKKRELYIFNIAKPIVRIALLVILIPLYGIWGAIFSFILTQLITGIILLALFRKMSNARVSA